MDVTSSGISAISAFPESFLRANDAEHGVDRAGPDVRPVNTVVPHAGTPPAGSSDIELMPVADARAAEPDEPQVVVHPVASAAAQPADAQRPAPTFAERAARLRAADAARVHRALDAIEQRVHAAAPFGTRLGRGLLVLAGLAVVARVLPVGTTPLRSVPTFPEHVQPVSLSEVMSDVSRHLESQGLLGEAVTLVATQAEWRRYSLPALTSAAANFLPAEANGTVFYAQEDIFHRFTNATEREALNDELARGVPRAIDEFNGAFLNGDSTLWADELAKLMRAGTLSPEVLDLTDVSRPALQQALGRPGPVLLGVNLYNLVCEATGDENRIRCPGGEPIRLPRPTDAERAASPGFYHEEVPAYEGLAPGQLGERFDIVAKLRAQGRPVVLVMPDLAFSANGREDYDASNAYDDIVNAVRGLGFAILPGVRTDIGLHATVAVSSEMQAVVDGAGHKI